MKLRHGYIFLIWERPVTVTTLPVCLQCVLEIIHCKKHNVNEDLSLTHLFVHSFNVCVENGKLHFRWTLLFLPVISEVVCLLRMSTVCALNAGLILFCQSFFAIIYQTVKMSLGSLPGRTQPLSRAHVYSYSARGGRTDADKQVSSS